MHETILYEHPDGEGAIEYGGGILIAPVGPHHGVQVLVRVIRTEAGLERKELVDVRFVSPDDPRMAATIAAVEKGLRRGPYMLRYAIPDDFGEPKTAFNFCTFWLIEALHLSGRSEEARQLFEEMLGRRTAAGLLSEDIAFDGAELWGNYPQTYSLVGLINCATMLSRPWASVR